MGYNIITGSNNLKAKMERGLKAKAMGAYINRQEGEHIREFIDKRENIKSIYNKVLDGRILTPKESLILIYGFALDSKLINKCNNKNSLYLSDVKVKGIDQNGKYGDIKEINVSVQGSERVVLTDIPRREVLDYGEDFVKIAIESEVKEKVMDKLIEILDTATLEIQSTASKKDDLLKAIGVLGKKHKSFTIVVNSNDYINLSNSINDLSPYDIVVDDNISHMYVGNLQSVIINYFVDKIAFGLNVDKGTYDVGCGIYNLTGFIADETAVCKIV
jgi:hypothetical protein